MGRSYGASSSWNARVMALSRGTTLHERTLGRALRLSRNQRVKVHSLASVLTLGCGRGVPFGTVNARSIQAHCWQFMRTGQPAGFSSSSVPSALIHECLSWASASGTYGTLFPCVGSCLRCDLLGGGHQPVRVIYWGVVGPRTKSLRVVISIGEGPLTRRPKDRGKPRQHWILSTVRR